MTGERKQSCYLKEIPKEVDLTSLLGLPDLRPAAAAEDFDAAAELLRAAGRRPEAEIEAEKGAVAMMAAEAWKIMEVEMLRCWGEFDI